MARAPHPAPRVSAHVVPKAQAFPDDEKTTIESGWEEEPSTTVEQSEVAEKLRAHGGRHNITNITSTNGSSVVDEPTVDDQRAHAAIALLTPPGLGAARLLVTQGNDTGQQLEVAPGKSYTIGRAIDNDFVLTDIAVSRKHFDLRHDAGVWVVADRGSGNGTLVNHNIEDQPFVLANGDIIEIGNTVFRFEQANAPERARPVAGRYNIEVDEEESSTVAGKPVRGDEVPTPSHVPPPAGAERRVRPKTVPPPAPLPRPRNPSGPPPVYPAGSQPASQVNGLPGMPPHLQKTVLPARSSPSSQPPHMIAPRPSPPSQPPHMIAPRPSPPSQPPPSLQGQLQGQLQPQLLQPQLAMPQQVQPAGTLPMPQLSGRSSIPQLAGAQGSAVLGEPLGKGSLPTTIPGQGVPIAPPVHALPYSYPNLADMHKQGQLLVVGNGQPRDATSTALVQPTPFGAAPAVAAPMYGSPPAVSRRTKLLLAGAALTLIAAVATIAIMKGAESSSAPAAGSDERAGSGDGSGDGSDSGSATQQATLPEIARPEPAKPEPAKPEPAKPEPPKPEPAKPEQVAAQEPPKPEPAKPEPPRPEPQITIDPTKPEPAKPPPKPEPTKPKPPPARPPRTPPKPPRPPARPPRVATADSAAARNKAVELYRGKRFGEAAAVLRQASKSASGSEARELRSTAGIYEQLGVAYNRGMSPGAKPSDAYKNLLRAQNLDGSSAAGEFTSEIKARLAQVSPKAALLFYVAKEYAQAFQAVRTAEGFGISNADTKLVRQKLEEVAQSLYTTASKEIGSNPEAAKQKLRQIRAIVDAKSPILAKAVAMLNGG